MLWIAIALALAFGLGRRLGLGLQGSIFAALTFGLSGVPVLIARAGSLRPALGSGPDQAGGVDFVATGLLLVLVALVLVFQRLTEPQDDGSTRAGWLSAAIGLGLGFSGTIALLAERGLGRSALHLIAPDRLVRWPAVPVSSWLAFAGLALATVSVFSGARGLRLRGLVIACGVPALLVGMSVPGTGGVQALVPGHLAALGGALAFALLAGDGLERIGSTRPARLAAVLVLLPLVVAVRLLPTIVPPPISASRAAEESEVLGFTRLPDPARSNDRGEVNFEGWLMPSSRIDSARLVFIQLDSLDTSAQSVRSIPVELDVTSSTDGAPDGARWFQAHVPIREFEVGHWSYRVEFLAADGVTTLASRFAGMLTVSPSAGRDALTLAVSLTVLLALLLPWRPKVSARVVLMCGLVQGVAFLRSAALL